MARIRRHYRKIVKAEYGEYKVNETGMQLDKFKPIPRAEAYVMYNQLCEAMRIYKVKQPYVHHAIALKRKIKALYIGIIWQSRYSYKVFNSFIEAMEDGMIGSKFIAMLDWDQTQHGEILWDYFHKRFLKQEAGLWLGKNEMYKNTVANKSKHHRACYSHMADFDVWVEEEKKAGRITTGCPIPLGKGKLKGRNNDLKRKELARAKKLESSKYKGETKKKISNK